MSERWTQVTESILDQLKRLEKAEKKDRLDLVRSMHFVLRALEMSLMGWNQWVDNPDIMTKFTRGDLEDMNRKLSEFARSFIEYDLKATQLGLQKGLDAVKKVKKEKKKRDKTSYVA